MPDGGEAVTVKVLAGLDDMSAEQWDTCAGTDDPFIRHGFLSALEDSRSACGESGWQPQHLVIEDDAGAAIACAPLYLKNHSYGEYVFDWAWADAYDRAGGTYYPKLQSAVPFTPVTGRRLLVRPDTAVTTGELEDLLVAGMVHLAERLDVSSVHITFPTEAQWKRMGDSGLLLRTGLQYHWENQGYRDFEDFLGTLNSRKRKAIRKERRTVEEHGITLATLTGSDIREHHWDAFYRFYRDTSDRKWGAGYLTRPFFSLIGERMPGNVILILAESAGRPVAGALNLVGGDTLYGRYWGCAGDYRFLHFETCYYQAIDFAINRGLKRVEAGAQGPHKVQRGYLPHRTHSAHWIGDPRFRQAIAAYLEDERAGTDSEIRAWARHSPFRKVSD
jgi:predicted N-acyltransferase